MNVLHSAIKKQRMQHLSLMIIVLGGFLGCAATANRNQGALPATDPATPTPVTSGHRSQTAEQRGDAAQALQRGEAAYKSEGLRHGPARMAAVSAAWQCRSPELAGAYVSTRSRRA